MQIILEVSGFEQVLPHIDCRIKQDQAALRRLQATQNTIAAMCLKLDRLFLPVDTLVCLGVDKMLPGSVARFHLACLSAPVMVAAWLISPKRQFQTPESVHPRTTASVAGQVSLVPKKRHKGKHIRLFWYLACFLSITSSSHDEQRIAADFDFEFIKGESMTKILKLQMLNPQSCKSGSGDMLISSFSGVCPIGHENGLQYQSTAP